jgi:hypothetical protein
MLPPSISAAKPAAIRPQRFRLAGLVPRNVSVGRGRLWRFGFRADVLRRGADDPVVALGNVEPHAGWRAVTEVEVIEALSQPMDVDPRDGVIPQRFGVRLAEHGEGNFCLFGRTVVSRARS